MKPGCPGELALMGYVRTPESSPAAGHIENCPLCQRNVEAIRSARAEFDARVFPATLDAVVSRVTPRRSPWWWLVPLPLAAATAVLLVHPGQPPEGYIGKRGHELSLSVFAVRQGSLSPLADGDPVAPGTTLQFEIRAPNPCWATVMAVDASGVTQLYPSGGEAAALKPSEKAAGAAQLDDAEGPMRLVAFCAPTADAATGVQRSLATEARVGPEAVRRPPGTPGAGMLQATVLLEKRR